jgi:23S rRNA (guanosine2251-2'-O)-methyltransferase
MRKLSNDELMRLSVSEFKDSEKMPLVVVLDNVRSCHNIGSIFRTCDAFLVEKLILCGITATPPNKDIHKSALGAENTVTWEYFPETGEAIDQLKTEGFFIYAIEQVEKSVVLSDFQTPVNKKFALVFGNEIRGIQQEIVDKSHGAIEIPQFGTKHSFNISVCAGIVLWDLYNKLLNQVQ